MVCTSHMDVQNLNYIIILVSLILLVLFLFMSLIKNLRQLCLKISGLFFILLISIYAQNTLVYVFALFIAATTITNQEFLENIAAIFRGGIKEVYKYKVEKLNNEEKVKKIEQDFAEEDISKIPERYTKSIEVGVEEAAISGRWNAISSICPTVEAACTLPSAETVQSFCVL